MTGILMLLALDADAPPWAHPSSWAAFVLFGE